MKHLSFWEKTALGTGLCLIFCAILGVTPVMEIKTSPIASPFSGPSEPPPATSQPVDALAQIQLAVRPVEVPAENSDRLSLETQLVGQPKPQPDDAPPAATGQRNQLQELPSITLISKHSN
jgi:hypothetical protein